MSDADAGVPASLLPESVHQLILNPQQVLDLPSAEATKRLVTASFFAAGDQKSVGLLEIEFHRLSRGLTLDALAFEYFEISDSHSACDDVLILANRVEEFVMEAKHFPTSYSWPSPRLRRGLWIGGELNDAVRALGAAAGIALEPARAEAFSIKRGTSYSVFNSNPEVVFAWSDELNAEHEHVLNEAARRHLPVITVSGDKASALAEARRSLHELVFRSLAEASVAAESMVPPDRRTKVLTFAFHSLRERMTEYSVTKHDVRDSLGDLNAPYEVTQTLDDQVEVGHPLLIGTMPRGPEQPNRCAVICGRLPDGRLLHMVVTTDTDDPEIDNSLVSRS